MAELTITERKTVNAHYLGVEANVRYWEDATVNGVQDTEGELIPHRRGELWCPVIDLDAGVIEDWPEGTQARVHYKVCDEGCYTLLDAEQCQIAAKDGYVPSILSPGGDGYGDYIIMDIGPDGTIANWRVDLSAFEEDDD